MQSTIRIRFDYSTNEPIIEIIHDKSSNDERDIMLGEFLNRFGGDSSWAKFWFNPTQPAEGNKTGATIRPLTRGSFFK